MGKTPEKRLFELSKQGFDITKKLVTILFLVIGYWQTIEYFTEKPNIDIYLENSKKINNQFISKILINNGSQSIISNDIIKPIVIEFSEKVLQTKTICNTIKNQIIIKNNNVSISFDLLNKNETNSLYVITLKRPQIKNVNGRIKDIEDISYYDFETKPKPLNRFLNIWLILSLISIVLFIDALLLIGKDIEFQKLLSFIYTYKLTQNNKEDFIEKYGEFYNKWKVNIKPDLEFMQQVIHNLYNCFPHKTEKDLEFIKNMTGIKTNIYSFYRVRTVFVVVSPILFVVSILALLLNYFYFEINGINEIISIVRINKIATTTLLIVGIFVIIFPSRVMNLLLLKKL